MSTVITDGYQLKRKLSLNELQSFTMELRTLMEETALRICERLVAERITDILDTFMVRGEAELKAKYGKRMDISSRLMAEAYWDLWREHSKFKKGEIISDPDANFDCKVVFLPLKRKLLALFLCYHKEYREAWESLELVQEYEYYDNTNRPDRLSKGQWERRKKNWNQALPGAGIPSMNGMEVKCVLHMPMGRDLRKEEIIKHLPSMEERVHTQAKDMVLQRKWEEWKDKEENKDQIRLITNIERWLRKEEGKAEIEKQKEIVTKIIKPTIQIEDLDIPIQSFQQLIKE